MWSAGSQIHFSRKNTWVVSGLNQHSSPQFSLGWPSILQVAPHTSQNTYHQKKSANNKCWRGCGEKRTLLHCGWDCKLLQPLWRTIWVLLKKLKTEPCDPAIPLLGIYMEKAVIQKDTCTPVFTAALFTRARTWEQPACPSTEE